VDDPHAGPLLFGDLEMVERVLRANQCDTAARDDPFLDRGPRRVQRVFHACFLLFHFRLRGRADLDDGDATTSFASRSWSFSLS